MSLLISQGVSTFIETITLDKWLTAEVPQGPSRLRPVAAIVIAATAAAWCPSPATDVSQWSTTHQAPARPARRPNATDTFVPGLSVAVDQWLTETLSRQRPRGTKAAFETQGPIYSGPTVDMWSTEQTYRRRKPQTWRLEHVFVFPDVDAYAWQTELPLRPTAKRAVITQDGWLPFATLAVATVNLDQWLSPDQVLRRSTKPRPQNEDYANLLIAPVFNPVYYDEQPFQRVRTRRPQGNGPETWSLGLVTITLPPGGITNAKPAIGQITAAYSFAATPTGSKTATNQVTAPHANQDPITGAKTINPKVTG